MVFCSWLKFLCTSSYLLAFPSSTIAIASSNVFKYTSGFEAANFAAFPDSRGSCLELPGFSEFMNFAVIFGASVFRYSQVFVYSLYFFVINSKNFRLISLKLPSLESVFDNRFETYQKYAEHL